MHITAKDQFLHLENWAVYFNGQRMNLVTEADDVQGYVVAYFTIQLPSGFPGVRKEKRFGTVRILYEGNLTR